jgi:uncharacterized membrane protein YedE/YeeE
MESYSPISALAGGAFIGLGAVVLLWLTGRIAGISGIAAGLLPPDRGDALWRLAFLVGLIGGAAIYRYGGGCTSGHGVCGLARLSKRSLTAVTLFTLFAGLTVYMIRHFLRGG